jgi:hypothetical protein
LPLNPPGGFASWTSSKETRLPGFPGSSDWLGGPLAALT